MVDLTVYLSAEFLANADKKDLEQKLAGAVRRSFTKGVNVRVSDVTIAGKYPISLVFNEMGPVETEDIDVIEDDVIDAIVFYFGESLEKKIINTTIHATIIQETLVELR